MLLGAGSCAGIAACKVQCLRRALAGRSRRSNATKVACSSVVSSLPLYRCGGTQHPRRTSRSNLHPGRYRSLVRKWPVRLISLSSGRDSLQPPHTPRIRRVLAFVHLHDARYRTDHSHSLVHTILAVLIGRIHSLASHRDELLDVKREQLRPEARHLRERLLHQNPPPPSSRTYLRVRRIQAETRRPLSWTATVTRSRTRDRWRMKLPYLPTDLHLTRAQHHSLEQLVDNGKEAMHLMTRTIVGRAASPDSASSSSTCEPGNKSAVCAKPTDGGSTQTLPIVLGAV